MTDWFITGTAHLVISRITPGSHSEITPSGLRGADEILRIESRLIKCTATAFPTVLFL